MLRRIWKPHTPLMLGRWNTRRAARKAELANHDHCGGPLCANAPPRVKKPKVSESLNYDSTMDVTLCALQSFHAHGTRA